MLYFTFNDQSRFSIQDLFKVCVGKKDPCFIADVSFDVLRKRLDISFIVFPIFTDTSYFNRTHKIHAILFASNSWAVPTCVIKSRNNIFINKIYYYKICNMLDVHVGTAIFSCERNDE